MFGAGGVDIIRQVARQRPRDNAADHQRNLVSGGRVSQFVEQESRETDTQ